MSADLGSVGLMSLVAWPLSPMSLCPLHTEPETTPLFNCPRSAVAYIHDFLKFKPWLPPNQP